MMKIKTIALSVSILFLSSCGILIPNTGSPSKCYNPYSYSILKDGLWGAWQTYDIAGYSSHIRYNSKQCEVFIYNPYGHPSDYDFKITIRKDTAISDGDGWTSYQGEISIGQYTSIADTYTLRDQGKTIRATIKADKKMTSALEKNGLWGTLNIFYGDGKGRGFTFYPR
jgi:hypothetical protein